MKHQGYGKVVEVPKVSNFMGLKRKRGGVKRKGRKKEMRGKGSGSRGGNGLKKIMRTHTHTVLFTHTHTLAYFPIVLAGMAELRSPK